MRNFTLGAVCAATALACAAPTSGGVLLDGAPTGPRLDSISNLATSGNFLVEIIVTGTVQVTGFGVFGATNFGAVGQSATVKVRDDVGGSPAGSNRFELQTPITRVETAPGIDQPLVIADFTAFQLDAGTYWIGMSGTTSDLGWSTYQSDNVILPTNQARLHVEDLLPTSTFFPVRGNLAFRIYGESDGVVQLAPDSGPRFPPNSTTPEPSTWAMLLLGFFGLGASLRHRRAALIGARHA